MAYLNSFAIGVLSALAMVACSKASDSGDGGDSGGAPSLGSGNLGGSPFVTDSRLPPASFIKGADGSCQLNIAEETCATVAFESETVPLDLYLMFDRSGSMCSCVDPVIFNGPCPDVNCRKTRMQAIREAVSAFVNSDGSRGLGVGIGYFGQQPIGSADCNPATYSAPDVPIDVLPNNGALVESSLSFAEPIGETPTGGAIRGACAYARDWKTSHPTHQTAILFVTDGEPKAPVSCPNGVGACCPTLTDAVDAAKECSDGDTPIRTYVLGVGPFLSNLGQIAVAGGTKAAYLVEEGDVSAQVLSALNKIRGDASIPCDFPIPPPSSGKTLDLNRIGIAYTDLDCNAKVFTRVGSAEDCATGDGWYFDNNDSPSLVRLCSTSCSQVSSAGGQLLYSVGCGWETTIQ